MRKQMFQLSKSRAEEQQALERTRKMFEEEEEEEEEMTDEGTLSVVEHSVTSTLSPQTPVTRNLCKAPGHWLQLSSVRLAATLMMMKGAWGGRSHQ